MFHLFKLINTIDNDDTLTIYIEEKDYSDGIVEYLGLKFEKFVTPAAFIMGTFMLAAICFHLSISDPIIPTAPSTMMFLSCIAIIYLDKKVSKSL